MFDLENSESKVPQRWLIPSNKKYYDVEAAFTKLLKINWKQSFKAIAGDIVYIYITAPVQAIKFKCVVTETDLTERMIDDTEFVRDGTPYSSYGKHMVLRLQEIFPFPITAAQLKSVGVAVVRGPMKVKPEVFQLIETAGHPASGRVEEVEDEKLVDDLKADSLFTAPAEFEYAGRPKPKVQLTEASGSQSYPRDRQTAINALAHANYKCELNGNHETFLRRYTGVPYTEPHHLIPLAYHADFDVSLDTEENIVSLCSNCHNHLHYGQDYEALLRKLYMKRRIALEKAGLHITFEKLLSYYK